MDNQKLVDWLDDYLPDVEDARGIASRAFGRAYVALRMQLLSGALKPGQHLDINALAKGSGVSTSPMREALCTLAAERLLQSTKGSGFRVPTFDFAATTDLLRWSDHLAALCVKTSPRRYPESRRHTKDDHLLRVLLLFQAIGHIRGNREFAHALLSTTLRLHMLYRSEPAILTNSEEELSALEDALLHTRPTLPKMLRAFHRRRIAALPQIIRLTHSFDCIS